MEDVVNRYFSSLHKDFLGVKKVGRNVG